ncbi:MAG: helix-turn-helix transcriptional regulator [Syntrophales bacterium]
MEEKHKLSPCQKEIVILASCGYSNAEIAEKMNISKIRLKIMRKKSLKQLVFIIVANFFQIF